MTHSSRKYAASAPFFACVSYHALHGPFWIPDTDRERIRDADFPFPTLPSDGDLRLGVMDQWLNEFHGFDATSIARIMDEENLRWLYATFYGMVYDLDCKVGQLRDQLRQQGILANTAIIFASDHGSMLGHHGMGLKRSFYDYSTRVPLICSFPGHWGTGIRVDHPVSLLDLLPTFGDFARSDIPEDVTGVSLLPCLEGHAVLPKRVIFSEYHGEGVHAPCFKALRDHYKYIYVHGHEERLYDLQADPDENRNAIDAHPEVARDLHQALLTQFDPDQVAANALLSQHNRQFILRKHLQRQAATTIA